MLFSHGCHYVDLLQWFFGTPDRVAMMGTRRGSEWMEGAEERVTFEEPRIRSRWPAMHRHFIRCVQEDRQPPVSVADGLNAIVVADAAHRSLKEGREIAVEA